jgi:hypothetical protein
MTTQNRGVNNQALYWKREQVFDRQSSCYSSNGTGKTQSGYGDSNPGHVAWEATVLALKHDEPGEFRAFALSLNVQPFWNSVLEQAVLAFGKTGWLTQPG